jgi:hypothetical protein
VLRGTINALGTFRITIQTVDAVGARTTKVYTLTGNPTPVIADGTGIGGSRSLCVPESSLKKAMGERGCVSPSRKPTRGAHATPLAAAVALLMPAYHSFQMYQPGDVLPLVLDGNTVATVAVSDLLA